MGSGTTTGTSENSCVIDVIAALPVVPEGTRTKIFVETSTPGTGPKLITLLSGGGGAPPIPTRIGGGGTVETVSVTVAVPLPDTVPATSSAASSSNAAPAVTLKPKGTSIKVSEAVDVNCVTAIAVEENNNPGPCEVISGAAVISVAAAVPHGDRAKRKAGVGLVELLCREASN